jgi:hypothetical protein
MTEWSKKWLMRFNAKKCHVMRLKRSRQNIVSINNYNIDVSTLEEVEHHPYLGVELGAGSSTLNHFNCINLILAERFPYRWSVFKVWAYECCVCFLLDFFAAFIEVPPKECQNAICWLMRFNAKKCHVMRLKRSRQNIVSINNYNIDGSTLEEVEHDPYLGVELGND